MMMMMMMMMMMKFNMYKVKDYCTFSIWDVMAVYTL